VKSIGSRWPVLVALTLLVTTIAAPVAAASQQPRPRAAQDEFVPVDELPQDEKLPAARLLIAAYSVAWIAVAAYLWSIWQRLGRVERELADVSRRTSQRTPAPRRSEGGG
jgi:CcmD family protein